MKKKVLKENADLHTVKEKQTNKLETLDESLITLSEKLKLNSDKLSPGDVSSYITASEGRFVFKKNW